ncbi:SIMPL domain-containing protein [Luteimonas sp. MC1825]|uniref:SIMPL domain-containing protein n=1 Tax=Luteimonas sp. MC1825 TaxID=2761107 RepID=UPI0016111414|nr:SIMPL domain-containing protein [Luteimonas sp. MC1825]MBB6599594.1 SIMPL domain-containing protein [Luteimonas sp. MC1825]QOC87287.1 SIMPL domain-containing protein [Luteimonas sp. MC1825]
MRPWLIAVILPLLSAAALAGTPLPDAPHVVVQGEGLVSVAPDSATVAMVVRHRSADPAEAKRVVDRAVNALLKVAPGFDVASDDMTASDLALREDIDYDDNDRPLSQGHVASREVKVRLDDLDRLGAWLDAALAAGFTDVSDVSFKSSKEASLREDARARAVADAREKAAGLAVAFGGGLGPVYSINSLNSRQSDGYGATTLDRIEVTGSRIDSGRYLQPTIDFTERVSAVFEITR